MATNRSQVLWERAQQVIPGGVNSPVRAMKSVGLIPPFIRRAQGCYIKDADGNRYIDYVGSWGPMILGHAQQDVIEAIKAAAEKGTSYGAPTESEVILAEELCKAVPSLEKVRLVSSGTEATMSALRLARGYTGRDVIVKFDGCYHGHSDGLLVSAGSGLATLGIPACPGVPAGMAQATISLPYNDLGSVEDLFKARGDEIAAVILEPIAGNMGVILPAEGYLQGLRDLCDKYGVVLIFDEVITGFRVGWNSAQGLFGVMPDLTTMGKIIGGGLPMGAFGGKAEIMDHVAPLGQVYQAGTLSGNPLATAAGLAVLELLSGAAVYDRLEELGKMLYDGLEGLYSSKGFAHYGQRCGSMMCFFFQDGPVTDYQQAAKSDTELFARFYRAVLDRGIYLAPSQFECTFVSLAHDEAAIDQTLTAVSEALASL